MPDEEPNNHKKTGRTGDGPAGDASEKRFAGLMKNSLLPMPFSNFEDDTMWKIEQNLRHRKNIFKDLKLSGLFFGLGTSFGLLINTLLLRNQLLPPGFSPGQLVLPFQLLFVLFVILQLEKIVRLAIKMKTGSGN